MESYKRDTEVKLQADFTDAANAATDPTTVTLQVRNPAGVTTTYTGTDVTHDGTGVFSFLVVLDTTGTWYYRFTGTGTVKASDWKAIPVIDDPFV